MSKCPVEVALRSIEADIKTLLSVKPVLMGDANPPPANGVYMLSVGDVPKYVGEAKGSGGLRDRLLRKHLSGDDGHAIQRAYLTDFPDRRLRREHIKRTVMARWIVIEEVGRVSAVEQVLIWLHDPEWNKKERRFLPVSA